MLDRPVRLRRPEALVRVEAFDPALGVLLGAGNPVVRGSIPVVHVRIDDEVLLAVVLVQGASFREPVMALSRWITGSVPREQTSQFRSYPRGPGDVQPAPRGACGYDLATRSKPR